MLHPAYIEAIEKRLEWKRQMDRPRAEVNWHEEFQGAPFDAYRAVLDAGETYVMVPKFCEMVEAARRTVPDDLAFEMPWMLTPSGWIWFAQPFALPYLASQAKAFREMTTLEQLAAFTAPMDEDLPFFADTSGGPPSHATALPLVNGRTVIPITPERIAQWLPLVSLSDEQKTALADLALHYSRGVGPDELQKLAAAIAKLSGKPSPIFRIRVRAVGWYRTDVQGRSLGTPHNAIRSGAHAPDLAVLCFGDKGRAPFTPLAHFGIEGGGHLGDRVAAFEAWAAQGYEKHGGAVDAPYDDPDGMWRHEIRLIYTVFYLMAQKLAVRVKTPTDRATRRRAERNRQAAPPTIEVVTLRRLEADRHRDPTGHEVDWQWQWSVIGHWRWQYYATQGLSKRIWIHMFTKGPKDKPFKQPSVKIFAARR
jgi:hypothetical protein